MSEQHYHVAVCGANSAVGATLPDRLAAEGHSVTALSRQRPPEGEPGRRLSWLQIDPADAGANLAGLGATVWIHLAPLWTLPALLDRLHQAGIERLIAFSSTQIFTGKQSSDPRARNVAADLTQAEKEASRLCLEQGIKWTIFRPTAIWGGGAISSLARMARFVERFGFFPLVGSAGGLRQPVHADDLAQACLLALGNSQSHGRTYDLSGGSTVSFRELVEAVCGAAGRPARIVSIPRFLLNGIGQLIRLVPSLNQISLSKLDETERDFCFDHGPAARDFGFAPRVFALPPGKPF